MPFSRHLKKFFNYQQIFLFLIKEKGKYASNHPVSNPKPLGRVVQKLVNVNPGLNVNWSIAFFFIYQCFLPVMFDVVWDYYSSKLKGKQYKTIT